jgi:transposase
MASLQAYQSHGRRYYRIVESFRKQGKPHLRVLAHLGRADDLLRRHQQERTELRISSVSAGAVTALYRLAEELDLIGKINHCLREQVGRVQKREDLTVGESLLAGIIGRACAPRSKRAFAAWAQSTYLPSLMRFPAPALTSQHFWDQMQAVPIAVLQTIEQRVVAEVIAREQLPVQALAYDTTNFYTHIATTNTRPQLPQRGHNKQGRHDLRQLGLALVVDQNTQLPLAHLLYEGARSDMKTFADFLQPLRERLRQWSPQPTQLTLIFDGGASSQKNLAELENHGTHYVTALRPSRYPDLLAEAATQLAEVTLSTGARVRAWQTRREIAGKEREVVVVFSQPLYEGQLRGLHQQLTRCGERLNEVGLEPRGSLATVSKRLAKICARQYVRKLLRYEVTTSDTSTVQVRTWCDLQEYRRLQSAYFGLRLLVSDHREWGTAQIAEAYRGQSKVEAAFRDLKDPGMLATHPQFHWTDQKLRVHAWMCVIGYLLERLLWWRAHRDGGFSGNSRTLLAELARIRCCRIVDQSGRAGRPRVRLQLEEMPDSLHRLGQLLRAEPEVS